MSVSAFSRCLTADGSLSGSSSGDQALFARARNGYDPNGAPKVYGPKPPPKGKRSLFDDEGLFARARNGYDPNGAPKVYGPKPPPKGKRSLFDDDEGLFARAKWL